MSDFDPNINFAKNHTPTPSPTSNLNPEDHKIHAVALPILQNSIETSAHEILNASSQNTDINSFEHITRYLPGREELLKRTEGKEKEIETLCQDLSEGNWTKILQKDALEMLPLYALQAFHNSTIKEVPDNLKITGEQFSTLLIYWSAFSELPPGKIVVQPLFDANGRANQKVKEWIMATIGNELGDISNLNSQVELFFAIMRKKPKSEQSFLYISQNAYSDAKAKLDEKRAEEEAHATGKPKEEFLADYEDTICSVITQLAHFNVLHQFSSSGALYRMIPSLGMMQALLEAHEKKTTIQITPVIGLSEREDIRANGLKSTREMALPFPGVKLPKKADLMSAPFAIDFIYHDFYHSVLANSVPEQWRKAFIQCSDRVLELMKEEKDEDMKKFLNEFYERIIDMEHPAFRDSDLERSLPDTDKFFIAVFDQELNAMRRLFPLNTYQAITNADYQETWELNMTTELYKVAESKIMNKLAKKLYDNGFCSTYKITVGDLSRRIINLEQEKTLVFEHYADYEKADGQYYCTEEEATEFGPEFQKKININGKKILTINAYIKGLTELEKRDLGTQLYELTKKL